MVTIGDMQAKWCVGDIHLLPNKEFFKTQDEWSEKLLSVDAFCDATAILGADAQKKPFVRALLASISEPLRAALFGEFREGSTKEIVLADVSPAAFEAIMRSAAHLDPRLSPQNVIPTLKAARMYMIQGLEKLCIHYLEVKVAGDADQLLEVMSASAKLEYNLPRDVQEIYWRAIFENSELVIRAPSFVVAHGSIIARLVKLEEFYVQEEEFWSRLVEWSANAVQQPELLGPFRNATPEQSAVKRLRLEAKLGPSETAQQAAVLQSIAKFMRLAVMGREFFIDKVSPYLGREDSEGVMMFYLLGRAPSQQVTSKRAGLLIAEELHIAAVTSASNQEEAEKLSSGRGSWKYSSTYLEVKLQKQIQVTKIRLTFAPEGSLWSWKLTRKLQNKLFSEATGIFETDGRMKVFSAAIGATDVLRITPNPVSHVVEYAALVNVEIFGKKLPADHASDLVNRLSSELLVLPSSPEPCELSA